MKNFENISSNYLQHLRILVINIFKIKQKKKLVQNNYLKLIGIINYYLQVHQVTFTKDITFKYYKYEKLYDKTSFNYINCTKNHFFFRFINKKTD